MNGAWSYFGWGWFLIGFLMFVVVASVVAIAPGGGKRTPPDERTLRERHEQGEISDKEYSRRMRDLKRAA
jgi:uncharacterized membrane protein